MKTDAYIVPFSITGKYKIFKKGLRITYDKPYKVKYDLVKENNILMKKIEKLIKENNYEKE